jgi:hypothetical protein
MSSPVRRRLAAALLVPVLALSLGACAASDPFERSFDPAAPCPAEGQQAGAYPDLEALLPTEYEGRPADSVDSGRICSEEALGTLAGEGIDEVRFAGATWKTGGTSGLTLAVFSGTDLDAARMFDFYAVPAEAARRTEKLQRSETQVGSRPAKRLDVLGSDGTGQTVVTWQEADDGPVRVLLAADLGDAKVAELLERLGAE